VQALFDVFKTAESSIATIQAAKVAVVMKCQEA
jgi:hypothetical protein